MTALATAAAPARRYASPLIAERRARILDETRRMIGEGGVDRLTLRNLGARAGVSVTTIYNVFGDKEGLVAEALRAFHAGIRPTLPRRGVDLAGVCAAIAETTQVVIANRSYAVALCELYVSPSLSDAVYAVIRDMPLQVFSHWLWLAGRDGLLADTMPVAAAETLFANMEWAQVRDWSAGRIEDTDLTTARQRVFLTVACALGVPAVREVADPMLRVL